MEIWVQFKGARAPECKRLWLPCDADGDWLRSEAAAELGWNYSETHLEYQATVGLSLIINDGDRLWEAGLRDGSCVVATISATREPRYARTGAITVERQGVGKTVPVHHGATVRWLMESSAKAYGVDVRSFCLTIDGRALEVRDRATLYEEGVAPGASVSMVAAGGSWRGRAGGGNGLYAGVGMGPLVDRIRAALESRSLQMVPSRQGRRSRRREEAIRERRHHERRSLAAELCRRRQALGNEAAVKSRPKSRHERSRRIAGVGRVKKEGRKRGGLAGRAADPIDVTKEDSDCDETELAGAGGSAPSTPPQQRVRVRSPGAPVKKRRTAFEHQAQRSVEPEGPRLEPEPIPLPHAPTPPEAREVAVGEGVADDVPLALLVGLSKDTGLKDGAALDWSEDEELYLGDDSCDETDRMLAELASQLTLHAVGPTGKQITRDVQEGTPVHEVKTLFAEELMLPPDSRMTVEGKMVDLDAPIGTVVQDGGVVRLTLRQVGGAGGKKTPRREPEPVTPRRSQRRTNGTRTESARRRSARIKQRDATRAAEDAAPSEGSGEEGSEEIVGRGGEADGNGETRERAQPSRARRSLQGEGARSTNSSSSTGSPASGSTATGSPGDSQSEFYMNE